VAEAELTARSFELYHNLARWLCEKREDEIEAAYREIGRRRFCEGVPLSELVYALIIMKQHLWDFIRKNDLPETATNLYGEEQLELMVGQFFDKGLYHAVRGYEDAWFQEAGPRLLTGAAPQLTASSGRKR